jgi:hypothetical protein
MFERFAPLVGNRALGRRHPQAQPRPAPRFFLHAEFRFFLFGGHRRNKFCSGGLPEFLIGRATATVKSYVCEPEVF